MKSEPNVACTGFKPYEDSRIDSTKANVGRPRINLSNAGQFVDRLTIEALAWHTLGTPPNATVLLYVCHEESETVVDVGGKSAQAEHENTSIQRCQPRKKRQEKSEAVIPTEAGDVVRPRKRRKLDS